MKLDWQRVRSERGPYLGILDVRFDWMRHPANERVLRRLGGCRIAAAAVYPTAS